MTWKFIKWASATLFSIPAFFLAALYFTPIPDEQFVKVEDLSIIKTYSAEGSIHSLDSLKRAFGADKILPPGFELQALLALSHYPELKNVKVEFIIKKTPIPLASRPDIFSYFKNRSARKFCVIISDQSMEAMNYILLKNLTFNAQVGILGHELAHTSYYLDKSFLQVCKLGASYPFNRFRSNFERSTDRRAIYKGFGWQLLEYADIVRNHPQSAYEENKWIDQYYLTPDEIRRIMDDLQVY